MQRELTAEGWVGEGGSSEGGMTAGQEMNSSVHVKHLQLGL